MSLPQMINVDQARYVRRWAAHDLPGRDGITIVSGISTCLRLNPALRGFGR